MKQIVYILLSCLTVASFQSCELFKIDSYDEPAETLKGEVVDAATGERVLTDQGSEGTRIRLRELSWTETAVPDNFDFWCMKEGVFQNTKVFKGYYNVRIDGAFIPLVRLDQQGDTIFDGSKYLDIKGVTDVKFEVQPFLKVEWIGEPEVSEGKVTAKFKVTRAVSPEEFRSKIEPMGGYDNNFLNVTDVRLFVSQVAYVGYREWDNRYSVEKTFGGDSFNALLGETVTLTTNGVIPSGRTVFIRAAARINYRTENVSRHNYNEARQVTIP
jgi:hypothetical protein